MSDLVTIRTDPVGDGSYHVVVECGDDHLQAFDRPLALEHARAVLAVVARAEYDAAILRQLTPEVGAEAAAAMVVVARAGRAEIEWSGPLTLTPGVAASGEPFLNVSFDERVGQWTIPDAREYALALLEALEAAVLDAGYRRALAAGGVSESVAGMVVEALSSYRTGVVPESSEASDHD